jgi:hypothetical protein
MFLTSLCTDNRVAVQEYLKLASEHQATANSYVTVYAASANNASRTFTHDKGW